MHLVLARSLRVLAAALFATGVWADAGHASQCVWGEVERPDPRMAAITHAFLTSSSFPLGSQVYPAMPAGGFPIRFLPDDTLESKQYPPGTLVSRQRMGERPFHVEIRLAPPGP